MTASTSLLGEAELHGLVDGHIEVDRRADVLRRLAASPADRALVEAWQDQNDLIRAAFRDVEREVLPVALDLAPPRLRCIEGGSVESEPDQAIAPLRAPLREPKSSRRRSAIATAATLLVVAGGLAGSWLMFGQGREDEAVATSAATSQPTVEAVLADRAAAALDGTARKAPASDAGLPAIRIPDLSTAGLRLVSVSTQASEPASMVLRYRDTSDGRVVLGIAGAPSPAATPPTSIGKSLTWRRGGAAYALAGTLPLQRLRTLVQSLQNDAGRY